MTYLHDGQRKKHVFEVKDKKYSIFSIFPYFVIGFIGGELEADGANLIKDIGKIKPVIGFIAGETAPKGRTMGHAGAIVGGKDDTAEAKKRIMRSCGIFVVDSPAEIGKKVAEVLA